jgi:hypothetical protein
MAKLVFGMNMSLDGYVDHDHDAFAPDPVLFKYFVEQTRKAAGSIYGRGLYEVMRYWDGDNWGPGRSGDGRRSARVRRSVAGHAEMGGVAFAEISGAECDVDRR